MVKNMSNLLLKNKTILKNSILPMLSLVTLLVGILLNNYYILFISVLLIYISLIIDCLKDWKKKILLLAFLLAIFLFILGNPTITILLGKEFNKIYSKENINFGFYCLYASLFGLFISNFLHDYKNIKYKKDKDFFRFSFDINFIKKVVILPILALSGMSLLLLGIEEIVFISNHTYVDFYAKFSSQLPIFIRMFVQFWLISVCFYLATKPKMKNAVLILCINLLLNVPSFIVGMRSPLMINVAFMLIYITIRYIQANKKFNIKFIIVGVCLVPILMVGLSVYGSSRNGKINGDVFEEPITKFLIDQGHMFDIIADSKDLLPSLPNNGLINYVIGPVYDTVTNNPITRKIFGIPNIGNQNETTLKYSHNMKMQLSFLFYGDDFFNGLGVGTSYILETYVTFGYLGILLWSMLIAFFCNYANWSLKYPSKLVCNGILLLVLSQYLYTPRANALLPFIQINHIIAYIIMLYLAQFIKNKLLKRKDMCKSNGHKE